MELVVILRLLKHNFKMHFPYILPAVQCITSCYTNVDTIFLQDLTTRKDNSRSGTKKSPSKSKEFCHAQKVQEHGRK